MFEALPLLSLVPLVEGVAVVPSGDGWRISRHHQMGTAYQNNSNKSYAVHSVPIGMVTPRLSAEGVWSFAFVSLVPLAEGVAAVPSWDGRRNGHHHHMGQAAHNILNDYCSVRPVFIGMLTPQLMAEGVRGIPLVSPRAVGRGR